MEFCLIIEIKQLYENLYQMTSQEEREDKGREIFFTFSIVCIFS